MSSPDAGFREVLRTQDLPVTQPVTMLTDGGDSVRALAGELSPGAVHYPRLVPHRHAPDRARASTPRAWRTTIPSRRWRCSTGWSGSSGGSGMATTMRP